jgi:hypothetical protein
MYISSLPELYDVGMVEFPEVSDVSLSLFFHFFHSNCFPLVPGKPQKVTSTIHKSMHLESCLEKE